LVIHVAIQLHSYLINCHVEAHTGTSNLTCCLIVKLILPGSLLLGITLSVYGMGACVCVCVCVCAYQYWV